MRLATNREETISNVGNSHSFRMNATAKAFQILSSGIYEKKEEAIVRELSCNAYDSHVWANKADVPFRVVLPTAIQPYFIIEDFGVGMSEDEILNVYTVYFESTKTDSNDMIGALGLGSKTPFSYTETFSVRSRKDGVESLYNIFIDTDGTPTVSKLYSHETAEAKKCNGVRVEVPVASKDFHLFYQAAQKVYSFFKVKPELNKAVLYHMDQKSLDELLEKGSLVSDQGPGLGGLCVVMGCVCYDLSLNSIEDNIDEKELNVLKHLINSNRQNVYIKVNIGEADVAASRETLSLDERTKDNLCTALACVVKEFESDVISKYESYKDIKQAAKDIKSFESYLANRIEVSGYNLKYFIDTKNVDLGFVIDDVDNILLFASPRLSGSIVDNWNKKVGYNLTNDLVNGLKSDPALGRHLCIFNNRPHLPLKILINDTGKKRGFVTTLLKHVQKEPCFILVVGRQLSDKSLAVLESEFFGYITVGKLSEELVRIKPKTEVVRATQSVKYEDNEVYTKCMDVTNSASFKSVAMVKVEDSSKFCWVSGETRLGIFYADLFESDFCLTLDSSRNIRPLLKMTDRVYVITRNSMNAAKIDKLGIKSLESVLSEQLFYLKDQFKKSMVLSGLLKLSSYHENCSENCAEILLNKNKDELEFFSLISSDLKNKIESFSNKYDWDVSDVKDLCRNSSSLQSASCYRLLKSIFSEDAPHIESETTAIEKEFKDNILTYLNAYKNSLPLFKYLDFERIKEDSKAIDQIKQLLGVGNDKQ